MFGEPSSDIDANIDRHLGVAHNRDQKVQGLDIGVVE
jgi:hypothetical protein